MRQPSVARFGAFIVDRVTRQVRRADAVVHLTPKAFDLLRLLVDEAPRVVTKPELHQRLWPGSFVSEASLIGLIKELRRALDDRDPAAPLIRTVHAVGYALAAHVTQEHARDSPALSHWLEIDGHNIRLLDGENVIGRDPASRIWLDVASVSRRHARIVVGDAGAVLENLGSKNRTAVGDIAVSERAPLRDGDSIAIGPIRLVYRTSASGLPTETQIEP